MIRSKRSERPPSAKIKASKDRFALFIANHASLSRTILLVAELASSGLVGKAIKNAVFQADFQNLKLFPFDSEKRREYLRQLTPLITWLILKNWFQGIYWPIKAL